MRTSTLLTALASASLSGARIIGIAAPSTIAPNSTFTLTLLTENYIQSVADVAVAWGFSPSPGYPYTFGSFADSAYLGPSKSNTGKNVTIKATAPDLDDYMGKKMVLSAGVYSLYGVSSGPSVLNANVTVSIGESTGGDIVKNNGSMWGTGAECQ